MWQGNLQYLYRCFCKLKLKHSIYSNDVLSGELRVNVTDTRTGRVLWYQDRQLSENEIMEGIYVRNLFPIVR